MGWRYVGRGIIDRARTGGVVRVRPVNSGRTVDGSRVAGAFGAELPRRTSPVYEASGLRIDATNWRAGLEDATHADMSEGAEKLTMYFEPLLRPKLEVARRSR